MLYEFKGAHAPHAPSKSATGYGPVIYGAGYKGRRLMV